jgi:hypothetical protein
VRHAVFGDALDTNSFFTNVRTLSSYQYFFLEMVFLLRWLCMVLDTLHQIHLHCIHGVVDELFRGPQDTIVFLVF